MLRAPTALRADRPARGAGECGLQRSKAAILDIEQGEDRFCVEPSVIDSPEFRIELVQQSDYRFEARFDDPGVPVLLTDEVPPLGGHAGPSPVRLLNAQNRLRVGRIGVDLHLGTHASGIIMLDRILAQFEEFCVVTQSVRLAFPVDVRVLDKTDAVLHSS